ncbi:hypothetical protein PV11_04411 [Exophiala sideris]|uniref:Uncharacterized protein n=1 Tax=Exophiala sideris TaxID=1016849 RepID=A0A0D1W0N3_9EURO|nr:hypothetical protein PV11_04411 [Exophiala sideris]
MYRKRNGSIGFSFTRFAHAAVPNFFADETKIRTDTLSQYRRDMCYMHQIASTNPYALDEHAFYVAGVVDSESVSRRAYKSLKKCDILSQEDGTVNTYKIGPKFIHQLAVLNTYRQRELVNMLFWWEEECQRLRKLDAEEKELGALIAEDEEKLAKLPQDGHTHEEKIALDELKFARERVRMKKRQRPSQRQPDVEADRDDIVMAYHGRSKSVPIISNHPSMLMGGDNMQSASKHEEPPLYWPRT